MVSAIFVAQPLEAVIRNFQVVRGKKVKCIYFAKKKKKNSSFLRNTMCTGLFLCVMGYEDVITYI
jgi:hypothetical protein